MCQIYWAHWQCLSGTVCLDLCQSCSHDQASPLNLSALQVSQAAGRVKLPTFKPKQGVHIETDPKGTAKPIAHGDDTAVIEELITQLEVHLQLPDFSLHVGISTSIPVSQ